MTEQPDVQSVFGFAVGRDGGVDDVKPERGGQQGLQPLKAFLSTAEFAQRPEEFAGLAQEKGAAASADHFAKSQQNLFQGDQSLLKFGCVDAGSLIVLIEVAAVVEIDGEGRCR